MKCRITIPGKITLYGLAFHKHKKTGEPVKYWYQMYKKFLIEDAAKQPVNLGKEIIISLVTDDKLTFNVYMKRRINKNDNNTHATN
jgi:hypothetical protein